MGVYWRGLQPRAGSADDRNYSAEDGFLQERTVKIRGSLSCKCESFRKGVVFCCCFAVRSERRLVLIFIEELLTLQSSLESQTQQAWNDDIMEASPRLFSILSSFCYFLEAVTGQHHLIYRESGATWRKLRVSAFFKFYKVNKHWSPSQTSQNGAKWTAYGIKPGLVLNYCRIKYYIL